MAVQANDPITIDDLIAGLSDPAAYRHVIDGDVKIHETHISVVFLAGAFAYKIKRPIQTDFLDYSTLDRRKHYCEEELRLDRRYAKDLYLDVVPIVWQHGQLRIGVQGDPVEYAVKMRRFPEKALLSNRIRDGKLTTGEVIQLAEAIAAFHQEAKHCESNFANEWPGFLVKNMHRIVGQIQSHVDHESATTLRVLHSWSDDLFTNHLSVFANRASMGFIRECHGDLHLGNVIQWNGRLTPFDGIEFNDRLRWIDVLSDAAFLAMDLAACGHLDLSRSFMNAYLERTGDYGSLVLLKWYLAYRSLVRGLAASMRSDASSLSDSEREAAIQDAREHVGLAYRFTLKESPQLWITHGVSGSGKTTLSEAIVQRHDAFRLRSDIERKRLFGLMSTERPSPNLRAKMYSQESNERTYSRLEEIATRILQAGYSVVIDATFLKRRERERFCGLAEQEGVPFSILDCHSDEQTLRQRVADRMAKDSDASDADLNVLEHQLANREPLSSEERNHIVDVPDITELANRL